MMFPLPLQNGGAGAIFLVWLLFLVIFLAITYWVYQDAKSHSEHPAFLWAIVVFLAPLLGLLLYFLLGRNARGGGGHASSKI
jgi:apolipoprotein N-acyltransferase